MNGKNTLYVAGIFFLVLVIGFFVFDEGSISRATVNPSYQATGGQVAAGNAQVVKMYVSGSSYVFEPSTVKKGTPVRIEVDIAKTPGCAKSIVIPGFGVRKVVSSKDNIIEFMPEKAGQFNVACSMNMYRGTLTVLEDDGSTSDYVEAPKASGGSCGAGGGGCGCGGGF